MRDGPGHLVGQHGSGFPFVMFVLHAGEGWLRRWMVSQAQDGGFRKGPRAMGLTDLGA
jgi:hypothetical protein